MEILIIFVVMAVAAVMMYIQLKGVKPEVVPVIDLPRKSKKSPKKAAVPEKKLMENWDKPEAKSASPSPDSKKKTKKPFDPVRAGQEMVAMKRKEETSTLRERKPDEKQDRKEEKTARKQGFVMVEEKKVTRKSAPAVEPVAEAEPVSDTVKRLREILAGNNPSNNGGGYSGGGGDDRPRAPRPATEEGPMDHSKIAEKLREQETKKKEKLESYSSANKGGKCIPVNVSSSTVLASGKSWGTFVKKDDEPEAVVEETPEVDAADEE
eukprot:TRINITY_DN923_c2_g1_i1.p2 TRINITY_DN923_c2_g1~~TRINITY_DN923_c2_g1_i1.p2  ORF type:complete len:266 (+),score=108.23 TRINITY_DN923_c2_g1_i1:80-877(+)